MGMTEEFETSLQVLRGFETDISVEVNEIKVISIISFVPMHDPHISYIFITIKCILKLTFYVGVILFRGLLLQQTQELQFDLQTSNKEDIGFP